MREILFRGKTEKGEWIEGYYLNRSNDKEDIHAIMEKYPATTSKIVLPETVGQYTGLTANGKKMFEGDIIAGAVSWQERSKNGVVAFRDGSFGLIWYRGEIEQFAPFTSMCNIVLKIIGNIHDNPELLKGGEGDGLYQNARCNENLRKLF